MKYSIEFLIVGIIYFLRLPLESFLPFLKGIDPIVVYCLVCMFTMKEEKLMKVVVPCLVFYGLKDFNLLQFQGAGLLCFVIIILVANIIKTLFNVENIFISTLLVTLLLFVDRILFWCIYKVLGSPYSFVYMLEFLPRYLIVNTILSMIMFVVIRKIMISARRNRYFR